jgi:hypothetical protein
MLSKLSFCVLLFVTACAYNGNETPKLPAGQDYLEVSTGRVHRSCLVQFGRKLINVIEASRKDGMSCLRKLNSAGPNKNYQALERLFNSKKISYYCNEDFGRFNALDAHASFDKSDDKPLSGMFHPYVSINPAYVLKDADVTGKAIESEYLKSVLFHEYFHNLEYSHVRNVEYAYACEECCFANAAYKDAACKICSTNYKSMSDPEYLKDLINYAYQSKHLKSISPERSMRNALYLQPGNKENLIIFLKRQKSAISALTAKQLSFTKSDNEIKGKKINRIVKQASDAQISLYLRGNLIEAFNLYKKMDLSSFTGNLKNNKKIYDVWDELLFDMGFVLMKFRDEKSKFTPALEKIYNKTLSFEKLPSNLKN